MMKVYASGRLLDVKAMRKMCSDKQCFASKSFAKQYLKKVNKYRAKDGQPPLHIYRCPICKRYHYTSQQRRTNDSRRMRQIPNPVI